jgi:hypothetical protein
MLVLELSRGVDYSDIWLVDLEIGRKEIELILTLVLLIKQNLS